MHSYALSVYKTSKQLLQYRRIIPDVIVYILPHQYTTYFSWRKNKDKQQLTLKLKKACRVFKMSYRTFGSICMSLQSIRKNANRWKARTTMSRTFFVIFLHQEKNTEHINLIFSDKVCFGEPFQCSGALVLLLNYLERRVRVVNKNPPMPQIKIMIF